MLINWYPGHMEKARKEVKKIMPSVDVVIEVLDARLPNSSTNPMIEQLRGDKPYLKVLSKADLADPEITEQWLAFWREQRNTDALAITTQNVSIARTIPDRVTKMVPERSRRSLPISALILGIPNVGKSTLINTLVGRKVASVGNEPAITKAQQKIKVTDDFVLIDTPGMTWPGSKDEMINYRLAAGGAIRDTALEYDDVGIFAMDYLLQRYPHLVADYFKLKNLSDIAYEALEQVAMRRGCKQGRRVDFTRAGELLVREMRAGKLGRISLEEPFVSYHQRG
ncbi:ribosome biogenesis GTPase YlqF [Marinagarivorans algicola]|uniref:ribosome biogenesis GTPase YlqF n=1 Tax=Marinagarivorans algicola TaxID=1513270 RepID=UPI0006B443F9|nr:ribosome biogenesis GTPase YlqF [Marinagarivorans algicola]